MLLAKFRILLVEDNPADIRLMREALGRSSIATELTVVTDGKDAIDFLRRVGRYSLALRPHVVFLDLNLPAMDGREVLSEIKNDAGLRRIPVVVLTTSTSERDVQDAYERHANCYVTKPIELERFIEAIGCCETFWLETVQLPSV